MCTNTNCQAKYYVETAQLDQDKTMRAVGVRENGVLGLLVIKVA